MKNHIIFFNSVCVWIYFKAWVCTITHFPLSTLSFFQGHAIYGFHFMLQRNERIVCLFFPPPMKDLIGIHTDLYNYKTIMICRIMQRILKKSK